MIVSDRWAQRNSKQIDRLHKNSNIPSIFYIYPTSELYNIYLRGYKGKINSLFWNAVFKWIWGIGVWILDVLMENSRIILSIGKILYIPLYRLWCDRICEIQNQSQWIMLVLTSLELCYALERTNVALPFISQIIRRATRIESE